jgi:hypothetical protein
LRAVARGLVVAAIALFLTPAFASASTGVEHLHYSAGPYLVTPGANLILLDKSRVPKPAQDGYMVRMAPNLHYARPDGKCCGTIPRVDVIHLHHGVWLSNGAAGAGEGNGLGGFYPFAATGEEKTVYQFPAGYGYPIGAKDYWVLNYMIHNLTATATKVYITYDIDFVPSTSPLAKSITPVHPIWMDVEAHHIYPVFDVHRYSGHGGKYTFPAMSPAPYGSEAPLNQVTLQHSGALVATAGHVHPGGLYDDLDISRAGTTPGATTTRGTVPGSVRLFRSDAHYFDRRGPISWDMAMGATAADWRPQVRAGDVLSVNATYETRRASWYESMGIMVVWQAWNDTRGVDPFTQRLDQSEHLTHGHLAENNHHGGTLSVGVPLSKFKTCQRKQVLIAGFTFIPGDLTSVGANRCVPTVKQGQSLTFLNEDASAQATLNLFNPTQAYLRSIWHSVTACQSPCGLDTGISYPLANGAGNYDSGQLGFGTPAIDRLNWSTPTSLAPGTYTYYCRIHPFMRGAFRIVHG